MDREKLVEIMKDCFEVTYGPDGGSEYFSTEEAADRILAALEQEKAGDILITPEMLLQIVKAGTAESEYWNILNQKKGSLIFRPDGKEK